MSQKQINPVPIKQGNAGSNRKASMDPSSSRASQLMSQIVRR